jgi:hypothetical protein
MLPDFRRRMDSAPSTLVAQNALGLQPGLHIQAYDAALQSISGLSVVQGNILYGSAADTLALLAKDANATRYLANTGASNNPAWAQVNLANGVTGTLPVANGGTGVAAIPSFSVHRNGADQTDIVTATETKIQFTTEEFDTGSYFDGATNYRYTPLIAGKYLITMAAQVRALADGTYAYAVIFKNGSSYKYGTLVPGGAASGALSNATAVVSFNGSTDYVEFYAAHNHGSNRDLAGGASESYASGVWVGP